VDHLQRVLGISQRLACQIVGQHRSTQRHQPGEPDRDRSLRERLRQLSRQHPRWGIGVPTPTCASRVGA